MPVNSRSKGARGEREAAKYLTKLGFECRRNGRNGYSDDDLICADLPNVHIEVKYGVQGMDLNTKLLKDALEQAYEDVYYSNNDLRSWCVLWKPLRLCWRLTWFQSSYGYVTAAGDEDITRTLVWLNAVETKR